MVERLVKRQGLQGVRRGQIVRTTIADAAASCLLDRVNRQFKADRPNQLWVSDFTYLSVWQPGCMQPLSLTFARHTVGCRVSEPAQRIPYLSIRYMERFAQAGMRLP